jgi:hypothetical protein
MRGRFTLRCGRHQIWRRWRATLALPYASPSFSIAVVLSFASASSLQHEPTDVEVVLEDVARRLHGDEDPDRGGGGRRVGTRRRRVGMRWCGARLGGRNSVVLAGAVACAGGAAAGRRGGVPSGLRGSSTPSHPTSRIPPFCIGATAASPPILTAHLPRPPRHPSG